MKDVAVLLTLAVILSVVALVWALKVYIGGVVLRWMGLL